MSIIRNLETGKSQHTNSVKFKKQTATNINITYNKKCI